MHQNDKNEKVRIVHVLMCGSEVLTVKYYAFIPIQREYFFPKLSWWSSHLLDFLLTLI